MKRQIYGHVCLDEWIDKYINRWMYEETDRWTGVLRLMDR
jgi:hypothetical protein